MESRVKPLLRPYLSLLIIVPDTNGMEVNQLKEMVECVNKTEVVECEILSDNVYYYESATNVITCLTA